MGACFACFACLLARVQGESSACGFAGVVVSGGMMDWCERGRERKRGGKGS